MAYLVIVKSENIRFKTESLNNHQAIFHVDTYEELYDNIIKHYDLERVANLNRLFIYDRAFGCSNRICLNDTKQLPINNSNMCTIWLRIPFTCSDHSSSSPSTISL